MTRDYFIAIVCLVILLVHVLILPFIHGIDNFVETVSLGVLTYVAFAHAAQMESSDRFVSIIVYITLFILFALTILELFVKFWHKPLKRVYKRLRGRRQTSTSSQAPSDSSVELQPVEDAVFDHPPRTITAFESSEA